MNKKFYLGAILLGALTLMSGALTSCIDNDEPEGITVLRGAKADLLKAKAQVEQAKVAVEAANAAFINSQAAVNEATAAKIKAEIAIVEAQAKYEQARAAYMDAQAQQEAAKVEAEVAKAEQQKALAMQAMSNAELAIEQNKLTIAQAQATTEAAIAAQKAATAKSEAALAQALKDLEVAKATMTPTQEAYIKGLQGQITTALGKVQTAELNVESAARAIFEAEYSQETYIDGLEDAVVDAQNKLDAANKAYQVLADLKANTTLSAWEEMRDSLDAFVGVGSKPGTAAEEIAKLELEKKQIQQTEAWKNAEKADQAARMAYVAAQQEYNYLANGNKKDCFGAAADGSHGALAPTENNLYGYESVDGTHSTGSKARAAKTYTVAEKSIEIKNSEVQSLVASWAGYNATDKKLVLAEAKDVTYDVLSDDKQLTSLKTLNKWIEDANNNSFSVSTEKLAKDSVEYKKAEKTLADAQEAHDKAVDAWKKALEQYKTGVATVEVKTDGVDNAVTAYNNAFKTLDDAVKAYNTAWDNTKTKLINDYVNEKLNDEYLPAYKNYLTTNYGSVILAAELAKAKYSTREAVDKYIDDNKDSKGEISGVKVADIKSKAHTAGQKAQNLVYGTDEDMNQLKKDAADAATVAKIAGQDAVKNAKTAMDNAEAAITGADKAKDVLAKAIFNYINEASKAAQVPVTPNALDLLQFIGFAKLDQQGKPVDNKYAVAGNKKGEESGTLSLATFVVDAVKLNSKGDAYEADANHKMLVVPAGINVEAAKKATAIKLDEGMSKSVFESKSNAAFGTVRYTELTAGATGGTLKALEAAKATVDTHKALNGANEAISELKTALTNLKTDIENQVKTEKAAVEAAEKEIAPAQKAHQDAHKALLAVTKAVDDQINAKKETKKEMAAIQGKLQDIIDAVYGNTEFEYLEYDKTTGELTKKYKTFKGFESKSDKTYFIGWIENEMKAYDGTNGYIAKAEDAVEAAEKALAHAIEGNEYGAHGTNYIEYLELVLEQKMGLLADEQAKYEFLVDLLNNYLEACAQ